MSNLVRYSLKERRDLVFLKKMSEKMVTVNFILTWRIQTPIEIYKMVVNKYFLL